jgi:hypothetical protein
MPLPSHSSRFYHPHNSEWGIQIMELLMKKFSPLPCYLVPFWAQIFSSTPYSHTPSAYVPPSTSATKFYTHTKQQANYNSVYLNLFLDSKLEDKIFCTEW